MFLEPNLLVTFKRALKLLDPAGSEPEPCPDSVDNWERLRSFVRDFEGLEKGDDNQIISWLGEMFLRPKGIRLLSWASGQNVRKILRDNGFGRLAEEISGEDLSYALAICFDTLEMRDKMDALRDQVEQAAAREVVEDAGFEWPKPK